uniref:Uncharacterized protein n=1 Tax=viral metagenome TaxID=1070528 RepID=A0A6C0CKQ8_9ZZZZ
MRQSVLYKINKNSQRALLNIFKAPSIDDLHIILKSLEVFTKPQLDHIYKQLYYTRFSRSKAVNLNKLAVIENIRFFFNKHPAYIDDLMKYRSYFVKDLRTEFKKVCGGQHKKDMIKNDLILNILECKNADRLEKVEKRLENAGDSNANELVELKKEYIALKSINDNLAMEFEMLKKDYKILQDQQSQGLLKIEQLKRKTAGKDTFCEQRSRYIQSEYVIWEDLKRLLNEYQQNIKQVRALAGSNRVMVCNDSGRVNPKCEKKVEEIYNRIYGDNGVEVRLLNALLEYKRDCYDKDNKKVQAAIDEIVDAIGSFRFAVNNFFFQMFSY